MMPTARRVLDFWFADGMHRRWFRTTPQLDEEIRTRFEATWHRAADDELGHWTESAEGALALVIVLDQFPLNMYRGQAAAFSTGTKALGVTLDAVRRGHDRALQGDRLAFLYMPLMHSEHLADQDRSVALFEAAALEGNLRFARHHRELIRRFGRFPHRNAILGRKSTPQEIAYLNSKQAFTG